MISAKRIKTLLIIREKQMKSAKKLKGQTGERSVDLSKQTVRVEAGEIERNKVVEMLRAINRRLDMILRYSPTIDRLKDSRGRFLLTDQ